MDVKLLRESFELIAVNKQQFAQDFYNRLFNVCPQVQALFSKSDMQQQETALMGAIAGVIAGIEKGENVAPALHKLGAKHTSYNVLPEHYPLVGNAQIETFQQHLQGKFTPVIQQSWLEAYSVISEQMILGAKRASKK